MENLSEKTIKNIESEMNYWKIPGAAIAVVRNGRMMASMGFGYRNAEENLPVTADTQFGIASCSKSMTSALIAILVDKGI
jgi:CubicO group peptidase (beta-lactamase class C family)